MKNLAVLVAVMTLVGCDTDDSASASQRVQADVAAMQQRFEAEQRRIEEETRAREEKLAQQRSLIGARFRSVDPEKVVVELTNATGKDIDNVAGSLDVLDQAGNVVTAVGLTNWVPGDVYLPADASTTQHKSLQLEPPERKRRILAEADTFTYFYTVHRIQYAGEDEISFVATPGRTPQPVPVPEPAAEPAPPVNANQADPEACAAGQLTLETGEQYYPGPQCEHLTRNIDSERFKKDYILMCQEATRSASAPVSTARVQLSTCRRAEGRKGLVYTKRICCDPG